jgi:hypothetical protein
MKVAEALPVANVNSWAGTSICLGHPTPTGLSGKPEFSTAQHLQYPISTVMRSSVPKPNSNSTLLYLLFLSNLKYSPALH